MPLPILTVAEMRAWEQASWAAGRSEAEVIANVGRALAESARRLARPGERILILAGKGHNGDDARMAAPHLGNHEVELFEVTDPAQALQAWPAALRFAPDLIIDGLFGIGLNRPLGPDWLALIEAINLSRIPVLAVDVPSGLNADTGESFGDVIQAKHTVTVGAVKVGCLAAEAMDGVGRLAVADNVGLIPCPITHSLMWTVAEDFRGFPPTRSLNSHKGTFGHLAIVAGSRGYHGAAVLAVQAALRARPGLVTLLTSDVAYQPIASQVRAAMVRPWSDGLQLPPTTTACLVGPGLAGPDVAAEIRELVVDLWRRSPMPIIADASALDWLPPGPISSPALRVLTPHPGEAGRLLNVDNGRIQRDRVRALRELSARYGEAVVVLKGHHTLIGRSAGSVFVNSSGNPGLAQGGSGDVLAGHLAGHAAQPRLEADLAVRYAVWRHGLAADVLEASGCRWVVDDLVTALGAESSRCA